MKKTWLRLALAGVTMTSLGAALAVGCTGDDTTPAVLPDAGNDQNVVDTGKDVTPIPDGGTDGSVLENAKVIAVQAAPGFPALRFCFGIGLKADGSDAVIAPLAPLPDSIAKVGQPYPGLFQGTGGPLPDLGLDLSNKALTPYLLVAGNATVAGDVKPDGGSAPIGCDTLIEGDAGLVSGTDFIKLPTLPAGTLAKGTTVMLAVTGCLASDPGGNARCGSTWNNTTGNVKLVGFVLDRKVADAGAVGVQVAHLSSALAGFAGPTVSSYLVGPIVDSGADAFVLPQTQNQAYGELKPATALANTLDNADTTAFSFTVNAADGGVLKTIALPLATIVKFSTVVSASAGTYFANGANYTFVVVGDPTQATFLDDAGTIFNTKSVHVMGFPNNPKVK